MTDSSRKNSNTVRELSAAALRMLIVEDSADDAALLVAQLARAGRNVVHRRVDTAAGMKDALRRQSQQRFAALADIGEFQLPVAAALEHGRRR